MTILWVIFGLGLIALLVCVSAIIIEKVNKPRVGTSIPHWTGTRLIHRRHKGIKSMSARELSIEIKKAIEKAEQHDPGRS